MNVFAPDAPVPPTLTLDFGSTSPSFASVSAVQIDTGTGTWRSLEPRWLVYVRGGQVWQVPLTLGAAPTPVRVSDLSDACQLDQVHELQASGRDALAVIETAGADGSCSSAGDNTLAVMQVGDAPATTATRFGPETVSLNSQIYDSDGRLLWVVGLERRPSLQLVAYKPATLERVVVSGWGARSTLAIPAVAPLSGGLWFRTGATGSAELLRLTGDTSALSLSTTVARVFSPISLTYITVVDGSNAFDIAPLGDAVLRIAPGGTTTSLAALRTQAGNVDFLEQNATHVFVRQTLGTGTVTWTAVSKAGTGSRVLLDGVPGSSAALVALSSTRFIYRTATDQPQGQLRSIDIASGADTVLVGESVHAAFGGVPVVRAAARSSALSAGTTYLATGVLVCRPATPGGDCRNGDLLQVNAETGAVTVIGQFPNATTAGRITMSGSASEAETGSFVTLTAITASPSNRVSDTVAFKVGQANSLRRVTSAIP
jgi:hypothetical protein